MLCYITMSHCFLHIQFTCCLLSCILMIANCRPCLRFTFNFCLLHDVDSVCVVSLDVISCSVHDVVVCDE